MRRNRHAVPGAGLWPLVLAACTALSAHAAAARCPTTPQDAAAGFVVTYEDGSTTRLSLDPEGLSRTETSYNDGSGLGELLIGRHGYLTTQLWATKDGFMLTGATMLRDFRVDVMSLPPLAAGETRELAATSRLAEATFEDRLVLYAGPDTTVTIGVCTLRAREVTVTLATMEPPEVETSLFLPDVGISFLVAITGGTAPELDLDPVAIAMAD